MLLVRLLAIAPMTVLAWAINAILNEYRLTGSITWKKYAPSKAMCAFLFVCFLCDIVVLIA